MGRRVGLVEELLRRASEKKARDDGRDELNLSDLLRARPIAQTVAQFVVRWVEISDGEGARLTVSRYIELSGVADRTAWRNVAQFRELFPELGEGATPDDLDRWRTREVGKVDVVPLAFA